MGRYKTVAVESRVLEAASGGAELEGTTRNAMAIAMGSNALNIEQQRRIIAFKPQSWFAAAHEVRDVKAFND